MQTERLDKWFQSAYAAALAALERGEPAEAEAAVRAIQRKFPREVNSLRVLGIALLAQGRGAAAIETLELAVREAPDFAHARVDLAKALRAAGRLDAAIEEMRRGLALDGSLQDAWFLFGDLLVNTGEFAAARAAYQSALGAGAYVGVLEEASLLLNGGERRAAEVLFRRVLREDANQVGALCGLAAVSLAAGHPQDSLRLLRHAQRQSVHLPLIQRGLAQTHLEMVHLAEADAAIRRALLIDDTAPSGWVVLGSVLAQSLRQVEALDAYARALQMDPRQIRVLLSMGHVQKTLGRRAECEASYRRCIAQQPDFAEAYYSLADLKTYRFDDAELAAMQELLRAAAPGRREPQLDFALGRAFEQRGLDVEAFERYAAGNAARRLAAPFDAAGFESKCRRVAAVYDAAFFAATAGEGCEDPSPIFVVGLPRSGSTLVEQVLASHSRVEGTMELPTVGGFVRELDHRNGAQDAYPECLRALPGGRYEALGRRYLEETRSLRTGRPHFIDKMPNNFSHVGLIHLMLPNAKIIDVRRHPLDACFSAFKQYFAKGQTFTYDLEDLGRYYRSYLALMDHWDRVLPGKVLCLSYEALVRDTDAQVRRLLTHCGLPFESACLRFHENPRAVRTASSEQVRLPIYDSGIGHWRRFERQLEPLRRALGSCLERFDA